VDECKPLYVGELSRLMDGAEKDIVALKDNQRSAFDVLMREVGPAWHILPATSSGALKPFVYRVGWHAMTCGAIWSDMVGGRGGGSGS
jgi:hypothetical protein